MACPYEARSIIHAPRFAYGDRVATSVTLSKIGERTLLDNFLGNPRKDTQ